MKRCPSGFRRSRATGRCAEKSRKDNSDDDHYASYTLWSKWKSQNASNYIPERTYSKFYIKQLLDGYRKLNPDRDYIMLPKNQIPEIELEKEYDQLEDERANERRRFNEEEWQRRQDAERYERMSKEEREEFAYRNDPRRR